MRKLHQNIIVGSEDIQLLVFQGLSQIAKTAIINWLSMCQRWLVLAKDETPSIRKYWYLGKNKIFWWNFQWILPMMWCKLVKIRLANTTFPRTMLLSNRLQKPQQNLKNSAFMWSQMLQKNIYKIFFYL